MLYLLLGPDDYSKKKFTDSLVKDKGADLVRVGEGDVLPGVSKLIETDLFSKAKVFVLGALPEFGEGDLEKIIASHNQIVVVQESLDKRKKENKELVANKNIIVKQFDLPHGKDLDKWIIGHIKELGGSISSAATESLAIALGRDDAKETKVGGKIIAVEEIYNLWQVDAEIRKLISYSAGKEISGIDVNALVNQNREVDVFDLTNAIADNQKQKAMELMHGFLKNEVGADEKGAIIKLNALLSDQFRSVAMVQDFLSRSASESIILEQTGWKSGRLFVMKKVAARFKPKTVLEFLTKLEALDEELKSSSTPPKVLLDLIVSQLLT
jgi:DNA polymerase III delta subunit